MTPERIAELREMNNIHAVTKEGMFRVKTPEVMELLNALELAQERFKSRKHELEEKDTEIASLKEQLGKAKNRIALADGLNAHYLARELEGRA